MKILQPAILTTAQYMTEHYKLLTNFIDRYNDEVILHNANNPNKKKKQPLRAQHRELMLQLIKISRRVLRQRNHFLRDVPECMVLDTENEPFFVKANREDLAESLMRCSKSVYNYIERLIEAGAITHKVGHGNDLDFDLYLNYDLLLIYDNAQPEFEPQSPYLPREARKTEKTEECGVQPLQRQNLPHSLQGLQEHLNNQTINVSGVNKNDVYEATTEAKRVTIDSAPLEVVNIVFTNENVNACGDQEPFYKNTECKQAGGALQGKNARSVKIFVKKRVEEAAPGAPENFEWFKNRLILAFFTYVLEKMFFNRPDIAPADYQRAFESVQNHYFEGCTTINELNARSQILHWRIDAAARYIRAHRVDTRHIYPAFYLNPANSGQNPDTRERYLSFANTRSWWEAHKETQKRLNKRKQTDKTRLAFLKLIKKHDGSFNSFRTLEASVRNNYPHLMTDFYKLMS